MKKNPAQKTFIHMIIGLVIMFGFRYLPISLPEVTDFGMLVLGIFIGTVYLWTTVDPVLGSLTTVAVMGLAGYDTMSNVLVSYLGNSTVGQTLFMMIIASSLAAGGITPYIARFFLTRKLMNGRPWLFTFMICLGCFVMSVFVSPWAVIFIFWPILYDIFQELGYNKGEKYPTIALILVAICTLIGFPVPSYNGNGFVLLNNFKSIAAEAELAYTVNTGVYMLTGLIAGLAAIIVIILITKFLLKPDVDRLQNFNVSMLDKNPIPPMNKRQKIHLIGFGVLILCLLLPNFLPSTIPGVTFLSDASTGLGLVFAVIFAMIPVGEENVININLILSKHVNWGSFFMCATSLIIGSALTGSETGIKAFLSSTLLPIFDGLTPTMFIILFIVLGFILTNVCNSMVIGLLMEPVLLTYCISAGINPVPWVMVLILVTQSTAAITPAASPFAAILHGNKEWLETKEIYKYSIIFMVSALIIMLAIGLPMTSVLTGVF